VPIRVGGVPEHFNLPWLLAIEERRFPHVHLDVEWINFPGGTGEIMAALANGEIDVATPLTEGAITSIANGNPSKLVRLWVESPLVWGVFVRHDAPIRSISDLRDQQSPPARIAISRFGSGSELMSRVMAQDLDWQLGDENWVVVRGLEGALEALPADEADVFLWNKSMTQPHVDDGTFDRIDILTTPWPSFSVVATDRLLEEQPGLAATVADIAAARAAELALDDSTAGIVSARYGLELDDVLLWLEQIRWSGPGAPVDHAMVQSVADRMTDLGRITAPVASANLIA
jgi:sulfonate transport system substrate-binding protein